MKSNPSNKYNLWFSQACLIVFALLLLYLDARGYWIVKWFLDVSHGHGGTRDCILFMSTIYACSVCAWIAVALSNDPIYIFPLKTYGVAVDSRRPAAFRFAP